MWVLFPSFADGFVSNHQHLVAAGGGSWFEQLLYFSQIVFDELLSVVSAKVWRSNAAVEAGAGAGVEAEEDDDEDEIRYSEADQNNKQQQQAASVNRELMHRY